MVPFSAFFPAGKADLGLIHRLTSHSELQGLLRASVGGLQSVMRRGSFSLPASVTNATARFKNEADPMRGFIEERVSFLHENDPTFLPRTDLYVAYTTWASINGFHQMSAQRFYEGFNSAATDVSEFPVRIAVRGGTRGFVGINLN